jgi:hypothetical protein
LKEAQSKALDILRNRCHRPEERAMDLDGFTITVFCVVDEAIPRVLDGQRLRQRGPQPVLADSEVITMEVVGARSVAFGQSLVAHGADAYRGRPAERGTRPPAAAPGSDGGLNQLAHRVTWVIQSDYDIRVVTGTYDAVTARRPHRLSNPNHRRNHGDLRDAALHEFPKGMMLHWMPG